MEQPFDDDELTEFLAVAKKAADRISRDAQVSEGAAAYAVEQLVELHDAVSDDPKLRNQWLRVVARNHARRTGAKLHREEPFGREGSLPPKVGDEMIDGFVADLITEMQTGLGSIGSLVANKIVFDEAWELLSAESQGLLVDKYVDGKTSKEMADERGLAPGTIDNKLTQAKAVARVVFQDIYDDLVG